MSAVIAVANRPARAAGGARRGARAGAARRAGRRGGVVRLRPPPSWRSNMELNERLTVHLRIAQLAKQMSKTYN
jgi:hypothetical protein